MIWKTKRRMDNKELIMMSKKNNNPVNANKNFPIDFHGPLEEN